MKGLSAAQVRIQKIPNSGVTDVTTLTEIGNQVVPIENGGIQVPIKGIALHEVYVVSIAP
jgi:hypothetical protein